MAQPVPAPGIRAVTVTVHGDRPVGECYRFWIVANCNRPHAFLDPAHGRDLATTQPYVEAMNAVYLLGGRYVDQNVFFRGIGPDGGLRTDFTGLIAELRAMLDAGYTPWVVLDNVPYAMSDPPEENVYGNTAPPKDEATWERYVQAALEAMVSAFGRRTVESWWFRVGTEPDLKPAHWAGTREQFLSHYDHTVEAASRVVPGATIGPGNILNPAAGKLESRLKDRWGLDIIDHAAAGKNHCTGATGTRMDWFTWTWYGRVGQSLSVFDDAVRIVRERLGPYPRFRDLPLVVGEFAILHDQNGRRLYSGDTTEWGASFYAALAARVYGHGIRQVYEWAQTTMGVPHPRANVISMLREMSGGRRLAVEGPAPPPADAGVDCGAVGSRKGDDLFALVFNHHETRAKVPLLIRLDLRDARMTDGAWWELSEWTVDAGHASYAYAYEADCAAAGVFPLPGSGQYEGSPVRLYGDPGADLFRRNLDRYARMACLQRTRECRVRVGAGCLELDLQMPGHSVRLLRVRPPR